MIGQADASPLDELLGAAITYRIAVGLQRGQKAFTLQTLTPTPEDEKEAGKVARTGGFSLHAGIAAKAHQREKLERLCRYIARPAVVSERLSLTNQGEVRVALKTPYRDGTTHVVFHPLDFIARLAAGLTRARAQTGAVTLIQRFGSALNLNIHFHVLFLDGVYATGAGRCPRFVPVR